MSEKSPIDEVMDYLVNNNISFTEESLVICRNQTLADVKKIIDELIVSQEELLNTSLGENDTDSINSQQYSIDKLNEIKEEIKQLESPESISETPIKKQNQGKVKE